MIKKLLDKSFSGNRKKTFLAEHAHVRVIGDTKKDISINPVPPDEDAVFWSLILDRPHLGSLSTDEIIQKTKKLVLGMNNAHEVHISHTHPHRV